MFCHVLGANNKKTLIFSFNGVVRRRAKPYDSEPQLDSIDSTEWAWEQHAKCVGFNRSATAAPGPRMGGASWVTDAARVSLAKKPTETVDRAWIFGGVGLRRSAHVGVVKTCLLDPLVATSGSASAHQPVATGLCDLWSFDGDRWQPCVSTTNILPSTRPRFLQWLLLRLLRCCCGES